MIVFGVTPAKKTKPDGATDGEDKEKKKSKEKKVKKDVPCLKLSDALDQAPNGARALAAIVTKMVPGVSFNSVKLIWGPGAGMSHMSSPTSSAGPTSASLLVSGPSTSAGAAGAADAPGIVWSYVRGAGGASGAAVQDSLMKFIKVDPRLPWTFRAPAPTWAVLVELLAGKQWLKSSECKAQREKLRALGFSCNTGHSFLEALPEALASGKMLQQLLSGLWSTTFFKNTFSLKEPS